MNFYEIFTLILILKITETSQRKLFFLNVKICRDDYAKKYSNKVYIGMAVCKSRGDDINTKLTYIAPSLHLFYMSTAIALQRLRCAHSYVKESTDSLMRAL